MSLLSLRNIRRLYRTGGETVAALDGVDLDLQAGEVTLLLGPSGSGKTTLLNVVAALDEPTSGDYSFDGRPVPRGNVEAMTTFRRANIGYIFQFFNLLEDLTVLENVLLVQELSGGRDTDRALQLLARVGLAGLENRFPAELSGGQQQRVAIARSLAKTPRLLLGDEPTGNLDSETTEQVLSVLVEACRAEGLTALIVTHDATLTRYADRVIRMDSGKLVRDERGAVAWAGERETVGVADGPTDGPSSTRGAAPPAEEVAPA